MNIIIDLILVAIVVASALLAAKKGFIGTVFSLLGTLVAIVLSVVLCTPVSGFIDDNFVNPSVKKYIVSVVDSSAIGQTYDDAISKIDIASQIKAMPKALKDVLELANINVNDIVDEAESITENSAAAKDNLINSIASPISETISKVIALVGLFIILSIGLWVVAKFLTAVFNAIPVGKSLNKTGGLLFGIVRGLIIIFVISTLFVAVSQGTSLESNSIFSQNTINSTVLLKYISNFNPLNYILSLK